MAFRERFGLTGLIRLRLLSKDDRKGTPLDPKKTLKEQGVVDGSDVLVSQVSLPLSSSLLSAHLASDVQESAASAT